MKWSLRRRFLLISATVSAVALCAAGVFLYYLFERDLRERVHAEIHHHLTQLLANLEIDGAGRLHLTQPMADPRFRQPLSGLYWEVDGHDGQVLASRSLWDATLQKRHPGWENIEDPVVTDGPFDEPVILHARLVNLGVGQARQQLRVMVAVNETEVLVPTRRFAWRLGLSLAALALAIFLVSGAQLALVMSPLKRLRRSVRDIRDGSETRVRGDYPVEIRPIVNKLNTLLDQKEQSVEQARARASNFAHGLKTPLTIIETHLATLREHGEPGLADAISAQAGQIKKLVDRELVRARIASGHGEPIRDVEEVLCDIVATMKLLPRGGELAFEIHAPPNQPVQMDREDFIELVGNILDNARKWAASRIVIRVARERGGLRLVIGDDGPGIPAEEAAAIVERGRRLDETAEGSGIGLAIATDIVNAYRLKMTLSAGEHGGLEVSISLPQAAGREEKA